MLINCEIKFDVCNSYRGVTMTKRSSPIVLLQAISMIATMASSEKLVWSDEFDSLDESLWLHEVSTFPDVI